MLWGFHSGWWEQEVLLVLCCLWMVLFPRSGSFLTCMCCDSEGPSVDQNLLSVQLSPVWCSALQTLAALPPWPSSSISSTLGDCRPLPEYPPSTPARKLGSPHLYGSLRSHFLSCLMSNILKTIVSYIYSGNLLLAGSWIGPCYFILARTPWIHNSVLRYVGIHYIKSR